MDPLTHTATGLFLARAGLKRWTPLATPILILAANAPDVDVVTAAGGSLSYLHYHRHLTHSLAALPLLAFAVVLVVRLVARRPVRWAGALAAAAIALATHLLLDLTNVYGVRLWLPFSARWLRWDLTSVVDLWIWSVLLLAVAGPFLGRLVGSEIASAKTRTAHHGRGFAVFALLFLLFYNLGRSALHSRALAVLDSRLYQNAEPLRVAAFPDPVNPMRWRGLAETSDFFALQDVNLAGDFDPGRASIFHKPEPDPVFDAARATPAFRQFLEFSQFPFWQVSPEGEGGKLVEVLDLRFGTPFAPGFAATAAFDARLRIVRVGFSWGRIAPR